MEGNTIKMNPQNEEPKQELNVNDLRRLAQQLSMQNDELRAKLQMANYGYVFDVLNLMLSIMNCRNIEEFDGDFREFVKDEIQKKVREMTMPQQKSQEDTNKSNE